MEPVDESSKTAGGTTVEDLERFRQEIERYRARRKAVSDEFEGFVQGFKKPIEPAPAPPPVIRATAAPPREPLPVRPPAAVTPSSFAEQRAVRAAPAPLTPAVIPSVAPASRRSVSRALPLLVLVGLMVLAAVWLWTPRRGPATTERPQSAAAAPTTPETPRAPAAVTPAPAPAPPSSQSELTTTRSVWIRVIADGARVVNRELPAGARVPFKAERTIQIRAGDAGAIRLSIGGRDQGPLGRDGEVVTRSFTVPPR